MPALALDPSEVEDSPSAITLDPSEVEDSQGSAPAIDYQHPAGAPGGTAPGVPSPQVNMQKAPGFLDRLAQHPAAAEAAPGISTIQDPSLVAHTLANVSGIPKVVQGVKDIAHGNPEFGAMEGEYGVTPIPELRSAPKNPALVEHGVSEALQGATQAGMLLGGPAAAVEAPLATGVALGAGAAGQVAGEKAARAMGAGPSGQELAGTLGGLAAGAAGGLAGGRLSTAMRGPHPEIIPPRYGVYTPRERNLLTPGEPQTIDAQAPQLEAAAAPRQLTSGGSPQSAPIPQEPPPAYGAARVEHIHPIPLYPNPEPIPSRSHYVVGPDGNVQLQAAGELPASVDEYSIDSNQQHPVARVVGRTANDQPIIQRIPGPDVSPVPVVGGVPQRQLPRGAIQLPASTGAVTHPSGEVVGLDRDTGLPIVRRRQLVAGAVTHPAGNVVAFDHDTGLPIVDSKQSEIPLVARGENLPTQTGTAGMMSPAAEAVSAAAAARQGAQPGILPQNAVNAPVGSREPETGRKVLQPTDNLTQAQKLAAAAAPELKSKLETITDAVDGARLAGVRETKDRDRALEKARKEDKPVETLPDLLAARIAVDSPQAREQAVAAIKQQFPVVKEDDQFEQGDPDYGFRSHTLQVQMPNGSTAEVQIVPKDILETEDQTHPNYELGRTAEAEGRIQDAQAAMAANRQIHDQAIQRFNERNAASPEPTNATHDFNITLWRQANPEGDAIEARKWAMRHGYKVVSGPVPLDPGEVESASGNEPVEVPELRHGGLGAVSPVDLIPHPVRDYIRREADLVRASREMHAGLENLNPQHDADVLRANDILESMPGKPADQEQVYHHLENSSLPLTRTQQEILSRLEPLEKQSEAIFRKLYPEKKQVAHYVHRIAMQKGGLLDRILKGSQSTGRGNLLKKSATAGKKRSMLALESPTGERQVVSVGRGRVTAWHGNVPTDIGPLRAGMTSPDEILDERLAPLDREEAKLKQEQRTLNQTASRQAAAGRRLQNIANRLQEIESERAEIEHQHLAENLPDKVWRDKSGKPWTFKQATTKEIERETPIQYYKNAAASVVTNWLELRKAERAHDYLEELKQSPDFQRLAIKPKNPGQIPEGWQSTHLPQLMGYYFEPHVAEVFNQYAKELAQGDPGVLTKVNNFLTTAIFLNPIAHLPNLTLNWLAEKGIAVANPVLWGIDFKAGVKAFNAVAHQNEDFLKALDAGAPLQSQKRAVRRFSSLLVKRLQEEAQKPDALEKLQEALGNAVNIPAALTQAVNWMSGKFTWPVHDLYFLQSAYAKMLRRGMSLEQALEDTATYIPNERLPTRVFDSKALGDLLRSPALMFTRYHYGVLKAWGQVLKNLSGLGFEAVGQNAKGEPINKAGRTEEEEKFRALNVAAGLALMLSVVYPTLDKILAELTGNKDARLRRAGLETIADETMRVTRGEVTPLQAMRSVVTPSVLAETAADLATNRDLLWDGRKIYNPTGSKTEIAEQIGRRLGEAVSPAELALRASDSSESLKRTLYSLIGVSFPRHGALRYAAELRAEHMPDTAETPEQRKRAILRSQARYLAWQGDQSGMEAARKSGLFTGRELARLEKETKEDPLIYEAKGLNLEDLHKLYGFRGTTDADRKKLARLLVLKTARARHGDAEEPGDGE